MIKRFLAILSCAHAVIADEQPKIGTREWCPECFDSHVIVRVKPYLDEEVA